MKHILFRIGFLGCAALLPVAVGAARSDLDDLKGLSVVNAKIPIYNKTRLQLICFADRADHSDAGIIGRNAVMEIIRRGADPDSIADAWGTKPYSLKAGLPEVVNFWRKRFFYSEGVILGDRSTIDRDGKRASGSSPVFFRSPMLDLDGIGFEADFERKRVLVTSDVHVVLRHGGSDLRRIIGGGSKLPKKYERLFADSDSLLIDMMKREIVLIGNVVVVEEKARLTCDRLTIFLTGDGDPAAKVAEGERELGEVSRILAAGSVVLEQRAEDGKKEGPATRAEAEQMICDIPNDTVELSGEEEFPRIVSADGETITGKVIRFSRGKLQATVIGGCRISTADGARLAADRGFFDAKKNCNDLVGNVRMQSGDNTLRCRRMRVIMKSDGKESRPRRADPEESSVTLLGAEQFAAAGGGRTLDRAMFYEDVVLDDKEGRLFCDEMRAKFLPGGDRDKGLQLEYAECFRRVRTVSRKTSSRGDLSELKAEYARLNYAGNTLRFEKQVKMISGLSHLDCDKLDIFLVDRSSAAKEKAVAKEKAASADASSPIARFGGSGKAVDKAVAQGSVRLRDAQGDLNADRVTLHFVEAKPGEPEDGSFQSGGMKLSLAEFDGNVVAVSRPEPKRAGAKPKEKKTDGANPFGALASDDDQRTLKAQHGRIDFLANISEFHEAVEVSTEDSWLKCRDLYLYGARDAAAAKGVKPEPKVVSDDPDDDPFNTVAPAAGVAPARIVAGNGLELKRIRCEHDVILCRRDPETKQEQRAGGDIGEYVVSSQQAVISSKAPRRSWLQSPEVRQECEKIICDLKSGVFRSVNVYETVRTGQGGGVGELTF